MILSISIEKFGKAPSKLDQQEREALWDFAALCALREEERKAEES